MFSTVYTLSFMSTKAMLLQITLFALIFHYPIVDKERYWKKSLIEVVGDKIIIDNFYDVLQKQLIWSFITN